MAFTYFFRDYHSLEIVSELLLPFISGRQEIKIWDAGCANGPEPYTLALILSEKMGRFSFRNVKIYCTDLDISNQFEEIIYRGVYSRKEVERIPEDYLRKYFTKIEGDNYQIDQNIMNRMRYIQRDLLTLQIPEEGMSLVVCKNVLLHLQYNERVEVIKTFHESLLQGGYLVMEHTQKLPPELNSYFETVVGNAQIYRKI
ncbi:MAG: methyltransferase domain-containing protein [Candidatus Cloacimonetes bacterium]|nr:methyltransferase domain-containing protein [Candidatus Cloacimonadota bacterium]